MRKNVSLFDISLLYINADSALIQISKIIVNQRGIISQPIQLKTSIGHKFEQIDRQYCKVVYENKMFDFFLVFYGYHLF